MLNSAKITATLLLTFAGSACCAPIYAENFVVSPAAARLAKFPSELPKLGFDSQLIAGYGEQVTHVERGSKAFRLGLEPHDVILSVNGIRLTQPAAWQSAVEAAIESGGVATLKIRIARTGAVAERQASLLQY